MSSTATAAVPSAKSTEMLTRATRRRRFIRLEIGTDRDRKGQLFPKGIGAARRVRLRAFYVILHPTYRAVHFPRVNGNWHCTDRCNAIQWREVTTDRRSVERRANRWCIGF